MAQPAQALLTTWLDHPTSAFVEWVAHHRALGIDRIHVFLRDTQEGPPPLAAALERAGVIEITPIPFDAAEAAEQIRNAAIRAAQLEAAEDNGWGLFLAQDEYLLLPRHDSLAGLMRTLKGVHALSAPVRLFFADGLERPHQPGAVLADIDHRAPDAPADGSGGREWRTVVKRGLWTARLPGYPVGPVKRDLSRLRWLNGAGAPMPTPRGNRTWQRDAAAFEDALICIARVPVPRVETLLLRAAYVQPGKAQAMPSDLAPLIDAARANDHLPDNGLERAAQLRAEQIAHLLALPEVAQAYRDQCEEEEARITVQTKRHPLWKAILGYVDGAPLPPDPPVRGAATVPTAPLDKPAAKPAPTAAPQAAAPAPAKPVKEHPHVPDAFARIATAPPPAWFAEIYPGGDRQGSFVKLENHALLHIERSPDTLIVTFDNISNVHDISFGREPWAYRFVRGGGYSHFAIIARRKDWYRDTQLIDELHRLTERGVFARYKKVVLAGTSMGGFAAMAFASLVPGCIVLAYSPQTTLDQDLVPWEDRFGMGRERNWALPHSDAAFEIQGAKRVFVIYDPFFEPDTRHIQRLEGDNITLLKCWFAGHFSAVFIRRANIIKPLFQMVIDETLTEQSYYRLLRDRRALAWYRKAMEERAIARGHDRLAARIGPAFQRVRQQRTREEA
ncbi:glycosyltransferase family 2 protein [Rhodovulum adriaticum]|uniref:Glycosyl transferase family 2 n=1 Tax=Rhodovulum adriaticum TaxID=35804 RepID=A0A4R2NXD9_RHOAD|nr:glycosyltransferase family 2 protein [Rhodovulum adriaticum]MBK1636327.1 hypothetical protein [Rhodovulum adriaticum]TCP26328.1 glycosyl transferase family 2 [Rhodovulum adriaticum]